MIKKTLSAVGIALAVSTILSIPAAAVKTLTADSFSSGKVSDKWVADRYQPEEFASSDGYLHIAVGPKGAAKKRPAGKQGDYYNIQGKKLPCETPSSNTWTAAVRINLDDEWMDTTSSRRRAEFRIDLVDKNGDAVTPSPTIAIIKSGSSWPSFSYVSSTSKTGWRTGDSFINGDKEEETLVIEGGLRNLLIKANDGVVSYYLDDKKLGTCPLPSKDVYPEFMALGVQNNGAAYTTNFDSISLYDGSYGVRPLSSEAQDKQNERLEKSYEKKRNSWEDSHTEYRFGRNTDGIDHVLIADEKGKEVKFDAGKWYKQSTVKSRLHIDDKDFDNENSRLNSLLNAVDDVETQETAEMPDSYWDH